MYGEGCVSFFLFLFSFEWFGLNGVVWFGSCEEGEGKEWVCARGGGES